MSIFTILFTAALVNNFVLSQFLGICPFLGVSKKVETAAGMGGAVVFVITIASFITSLLYNFLLLPNDLVYLNTIVFILVIAALVQFVFDIDTVFKGKVLLVSWNIFTHGYPSFYCCQKER